MLTGIQWFRESGGATACDGRWRRQTRRPCRLPRANTPGSRRRAHVARLALGEHPQRSPLRVLSRQSTLHSLPNDRNGGPVAGRDIPLSARVLQALVAVLAVCLLLETVVQDAHFWRLQTVNQAFFALLLLGSAVMGAFGAHRSAIVCTACAIMGWWLGLSSLLFEHPARGAVPIMGMAVFFAAGLAADALTDSKPVPTHATDGIPDERVAAEMAIRRWSAGF